MTTLLGLLHRDLRVAARDAKYFVLRIAMQPLLFVFIFGYVMPRISLMTKGYNDFLLPGIIALSMTMAGLQAVALPLVTEFGFTNEIEDRLLAPISVTAVALEKLLIGIIQALLSGLVMLGLAWLMMDSKFSLGFVDCLKLLAAGILISWVFAALGMVVGTFAATQQIGLLISLLIGPMIFFGCVYYPWSRLEALGWFQKVILLNPLVYSSEAFRSVLTPDLPHMPTWGIIAGLGGFCFFFTYLALRGFIRRAVP